MTRAEDQQQACRAKDIPMSRRGFICKAHPAKIVVVVVREEGGVKVLEERQGKGGLTKMRQIAYASNGGSYDASVTAKVCNDEDLELLHLKQKKIQETWNCAEERSRL